MTSATLRALARVFVPPIQARSRLAGERPKLARALCALTETEWTPDHTTLHDFIELMGEEGMSLINEYVVAQAADECLADPTLMVADTTAQEAATPYPNEMGLMATFIAADADQAHEPPTGLP